MVRFVRSSAADGEPWWMTAAKGSGFRELRAGLSAGLSWRKGFCIRDYSAITDEQTQEYMGKPRGT
jgi:hypothetical protein